ncbi:MAG: hypothetical protein HW391_236 [Chloroflexi bacterium]|nr:hypothetical protein [Chloroflexota bacterium]
MIRARLDDAGRCSVVGVYRAALNARSSIGLLTLADAAVGPLPNGIMLAEPFDFLAAGFRSGDVLWVTRGVVEAPRLGVLFDLDAAAAWSPRIEARSVELSVRRWGGRSGSVRAAAAAAISRRSGAQTGLGALLVSGSTPGAAARIAAPRLERLAAALRNGDPASVEEAAGSLIGLGPGLTPSGDDALVGVAAAAAALGSRETRLLAGVGPALEARTTLVAAAYLRHAARGEFSGDLHDLLAALLGEDGRSVGSAIDRVVGRGATSGADTLFGVLLGLDALTAQPAMARPVGVAA